MNTNTSLPLSEGIAHSAQMLKAVLKGRSLTETLPQVPAQARSLTQALTFYALRHLEWALFFKKKLLKKPTNAHFESTLLVALTLFFAQKSDANNPHRPKYRLETITHESVQCIKNQPHLAHLKNLMNACLRNALRQYDLWHAEALERPNVRFAFPTWWIQTLKKAYPDDFKSLLSQANVNPPMTLRVNLSQYTQSAYQALLATQGIKSKPLGCAGLRLYSPVPVTRLPHFETGACTVQDYGAQQAGEFLVAQLPLLNDPKTRLLDACAAPGGKTTHLLEQTQAHIDVLDISQTRLQRIRDNLQRLQMDPKRVTLFCADATQSPTWCTAPYDVILADVPCTASGVIRRHPDIKYLRQPEDIAQTVQLQRDILAQIWSLLKPGGHLLYMTCSIFPQEGEEQAAWILQHCAASRRLPAPGQLLPLSPLGEVADNDGYFLAFIQKEVS